MRSAKSLWLSFSGSIVETVSLFKEQEMIEKNFQALTRLVERLGEPQPIPEQTRNKAKSTWNGICWQKVSHIQVTEFLEDYNTHKAAYKVNSKLLAEFISSMARENELTEWTVAVIGGGEGEHNIAGLNVKKMKRSGNVNIHDRYAIKRLLSPRDESLDMDDQAWQAALTDTQKAWTEDPGRLEEKNELPTVPSGVSIRRIRGFGAEGIPAHPERGLLLLYLLEPKEAYAENSTFKFPENTLPIVALGISFPGSSKSGTKVEYKVNNVLWEQEYGAAE